MTKFEKSLFNELEMLGCNHLIITACYEKLKSKDIQNICGQTIDDIMRRGFFDYIISKQEVRDDDLFIFDIDSEYAMKILKFAYMYTDSIEYAADVLVSQKYFFENKNHFEIEFDIECCLYMKHKHYVFNNVKAKDSDEFIWEGVHNALYAH